MIVIILLVVVIVLIAINIVVSFTKKSKDSTAEIKTQLIKIDSDLSKIDPLIRDEFGRNREENQRASKDNREELNTSFKLLSETLTKTVTDLSNAQKNQFETFSKQLGDLVKSFDEKTRNLQEQLEKSAKQASRSIY